MMGLKINIKKTKYMVANGKRWYGRAIYDEVVLEGKTFEIVGEFLYLGSLLTIENGVTREVRRQFAAAYRAFFGLRNQLTPRRLQTTTKITLCKNLILHYTALMNFEFEVLVEINIAKQITHGRLQWAGHVAHMPEDRPYSAEYQEAAVGFLEGAHTLAFCNCSSVDSNRSERLEAIGPGPRPVLHGRLKY